MKKLDRYILGEFLAPLALIVLGLASLTLLVQVVDSLPRLRQWGATPMQILAFHVFQFPQLAAQVLPVGVLLAALTALGALARSSELAAMGAGGVSRLRVAAPMLAAALGLSVLLLAVNETLVPAASARARWIQKVQIEKRDVDFDQSWRDHMAKSLPGGRQLYAAHYDALRGTMRRVAILAFEDGTLRSRVDAASARHLRGHAWLLEDGVRREFGPDGRETGARLFPALEADLGAQPRDFMVDADRRETDLALLGVAELSRIIERLQATGGDARKERVVRQVRFSYPFSCLILALLGVSLPYLFPMGKRAMTGAALGLLVSLGCGLLYLVFIQVGISLGKSGALPVTLSAWLGNLVFGAAGGYTLWKANS